MTASPVRSEDRVRRGDDGSVLLLIIGFTAVLLLLVAVVIDVSVVVLAKRGVASAADGAAAAAAQQANAADIRERGLGERLALDDVVVQQVVATYQQDARVGQPGLVLDASIDGGTTAVVVGGRIVTLPFVGWLGIGHVLVRAEGRARSPVVR